MLRFKKKRYIPESSYASPVRPINAKHHAMHPVNPSVNNPKSLPPSISVVRLHLRRPIHPNIPTLHFAQILQEETPLEIRLGLVRVLEDPVAGDVVPGLAVADEPDQVVRAVGAVGAAVGLACAWWCFRQQFLARVGGVAASATVGVAADVAVGVADVVLVLGLEFLCGDWVSDAGSSSLCKAKANSERKMIHSCRLRPMPFRNSVYCNRPKCFRWLLARRVLCRFCMQSGKCWLSPSMLAAVGVLMSPILDASE
ncbi:hypothetical protein KC363_g103 [Hortaea werneckii]|nr:hypothetical protein KC363_g103 [Hortaea werneckii]